MLPRAERNADGSWRERFARRTSHILARLQEAGYEPGYMTKDIGDREPKLHLKAQLVLSRGAEEVLKKMDWLVLMDAFITQSMKQVHDRSQYVGAREAWLVNERIWDEQLDAILARMTPERRAGVIAYLSVGSHNMDYRGLKMDAEVLYVTAGRGVLPGMLDLVLLMGVSDWVEDADQLDTLLPPYPEWQRKVGRFMKYAL